jgi:uncharacterized protein (DUF433 family)
MKQAQIVSDPEILAGKPVIAGTRISVELILDRLASGMSKKEILEDYPHLNSNQIQAAIAYAKSVISKKRRSSSKNSALPTTLYTHEISRG